MHTGITTWALVPWPGLELIAKLPPNNERRSRMLNNPKPPPCDRGKFQLFRNKTFTLVFHVDNDQIFSLRYVRMSFFDARMLDDVDQKLPHGLKSHDGRIAA